MDRSERDLRRVPVVGTLVLVCGAAAGLAAVPGGGDKGPPAPSAAKPDEGSGAIVVPDHSVRGRVAQQMAGGERGTVTFHTGLEGLEGLEDTGGGTKDVAAARTGTAGESGYITVPSNTLGPEGVLAEAPPGTDTGDNAPQHGTLAPSGLFYGSGAGTVLYGTGGWLRPTVWDGGVSNPQWDWRNRGRGGTGTCVSHDLRSGQDVFNDLARNAELTFSEAAQPRLGEFDRLSRQAQLTFSQAAAPRLEQFERLNRQHQLTFHAATLTPGVVRGADGLRHEGSGALSGGKR